MDGISQFRDFCVIHTPQLLSSGVPKHLWETLHRKLLHQVFDAGLSFSLMFIDCDVPSPDDPLSQLVVSKESGVTATDPTEIYLVDHAWTFRTNTVRAQLIEMPELRVRMARMMGANDDSIEICVEDIMTKMWRYCQMYAVSTGNSGLDTAESRLPIWYIMDEVGSGVNHSEDPNFRMVPFLYIPDGITYSLLFPIVDAVEGDPVTRDFIDGTVVKDHRVREALLYPWKHGNFTDISIEQMEPDSEYFLDGHIEETLPPTEQVEPIVRPDQILKVYSTYPLVGEYLTDPGFRMVDNEDEADILWLTDHFKTFRELNGTTPNKFINQFPFEFVLTIKDLLAIIARRTTNRSIDSKNLSSFPYWMPTTFNLKTELLQFVSYFQRRQDAELDNHWIVKPWNLARSLDMHITDSLEMIMRLQPTGPKIVQKYIERPVLFHRNEIDGRVKFDVRYILLVRSIEPIDAYIYRNFFLRFANKPFALNEFDDYEKHFTVMNYSDEFQLRHMKCDEFLRLWIEQYPEHDWSFIENEICHIFTELLMAARKKHPPQGIGVNKQSRALYAADIMLSWSGNQVEPKLLEINWIPDCKRACDYYSDFYNDIFKLLFRNEQNDKFRKIV